MFASDTDIAPASATAFPGFSSLADNYAVALCDVWGVLHNGVVAHQAAAEALARFRDRGGMVVLVSNAPKPAEWVVANLDEKGVPRSAWDAVVTSGDVARHMLAERGVARVHHIGPPRDLPLFGDARIERVGPEEASIVVVTGLFDDQTETPEDYRSRLERLRALDLPMICANPDLVVQVGAEQWWCAGAIADIYQTMGGETLFAGKPYGPVYAAAIGVAEGIAGRRIERHRVIAIGDAVRTDLAGATAAGLDCVFVADGIHGDELGRGAPDPDKLAALFAESGYHPVAVMPQLVW